MSQSKENGPVSRWQDRVNQHAAFNRLADLEAGTNDLEGLAPGDSFAEILHLRKVYKRAILTLDNSDPELVTPAMLNGLQNAVDRLVGTINSQKEAVNSGSPIDWAAVDTDVVIDALNGWPRLPADVDVQSFVADSESAVSVASRLIDAVAERSEATAVAVEARLTSISNAANEELAALQLRNSELESRIVAQVELIGQQLPRLENAITNQGEQFGIAEVQRRADEEAALNELKVEKTALIDSLKVEADRSIQGSDEDAQALLEGVRNKSESAISRLEALGEQAREIVGVIARTGMAGGYQIQADRERGDADRWRKISVGFAIIAAAVLAGVVVWSGIEHHPTWPVVVGRLLLAGGLGGISAYAARQSAEHRKRADKARTLQLALASIGPYLEALDDGERRKVLEVFAYVFFAIPEAEAANDTESGPSLLSTIATVADQLTSKK